MISLDINGTFHLSSKTESAGTVITALVAPKKRSITRITELLYTSGTTAHTLTILRPVARTTIASAVTASANTITLTSVGVALNPSSGAVENLAANDYIAWEQDDGTFDYDIISAINTTTKVVTLTGTAASAAAAGRYVWQFMEVGRASHVILTPQVALATYYTSFTTRFANETAGVCTSGIPKDVDPYNYSQSGIQRYAPLLLHSTNATAAGKIVAVNGYYARK
jgi:hypothetical protein